MTNKQVKYGAILSYILIILNAIYGIFLTPYIIGKIGQESYGVYKTISAFTSSLMVLDLGLGGTMMRYIARYRVDNEEEKIPNFLSMGSIQAGVVCVLVSMVTTALYFFLDIIYQNGLTPNELAVAKQLYIFLGCGIIFHIIENFFNGIICGYNKFFFANGIKVVRLVVRIFAVILFLGFFKSSLVLVIIDFICTAIFVCIEVTYLFLRLKIKIHFTNWDGKVFLESFKYTIFLFLSSIVDQVNGNIANVAIGAMLNSIAVTIYSMAILIFGMYEQLSTAISGVMLPTIVNSLKTDDEQYSNTLGIVVSAGRIQFILLGAVFVGFIALGRSFINLWLGTGYEDVYYLVLILLGPALLELCINVCLSILRAKNKLGFRTMVITISTVLNLIITLVGMRYIGYYSAAIGTACSFLLGSVITMGIYYYKEFKINVLKLYAKIFDKIWICTIMSGIGSFIVTTLFNSSTIKFLLGFFAFCIIYAVTLLLFGLNQQEKEILLSKIRRRKND